MRAYRPSTNLEQVADWLTKVLIGIGIAEATAIAAGLDSFLDDQVVPTFDGAPGGYVISLSLVLVGVVTGFLIGWIAASFYLTRALSDLDSALAALDVAAEQIAERDPAAAEDIRSIAADVKEQAPDSGASGQRFEAEVLAALRELCAARGWELLNERAARPWDGRIVDDHDRGWGVEIRYRRSDVSSGPVRFVAGRLITSRRPLAGAVLISNRKLTSIAQRELRTYEGLQAPVVTCALTSKPYRGALEEMLNELATRATPETDANSDDDEGVDQN